MKTSMPCFTVMTTQMKILLDSHIFIWSLIEPKKLSNSRQQLIFSPETHIYISAISIAELMIKQSIGKLDIPIDLIAMAEKSQFEHLDFIASDAVLLKQLPMHHRDPFDRMLICQAQSRDLHIMSDDAWFARYDCRLV